MGKPFIRLFKDNISSRFRSFSKDVLSAFSYFGLKESAPASPMSYLYIETIQFKLSLDYLGEIYQLSLERTEFEKVAIVSFDLSTEWKMYSQLLIKQPKDDTSTQLKELLTNDMLIALFPNLYKLATICLSIPIFIASAERSFSDMKLIFF